MRNLILGLTSLFLGFTVQILAQPTLSNNVFPSVGTIVVLTGADTTGVVPGNAGANQTWNFSGLLPTSINTTDTSVFVAPANTPYFADYPATNLAAVSAEGEYYSYFKKEANKFIYLGGASQSFSLKYSDYSTILETPLAFNGSFNDTYVGVTSIGTLSSVYGTASKTVKYDGYGTLILPNGTFQNAMRLKTTISQRDSAVIPGGYSISDITQTVYEWYVGGKPYQMMTIQFREGNSQTVIPPFPPVVNPIPLTKTIFYQKSATSAVNEVARENALYAVRNVLPNPAREQIQLVIDTKKQLPDLDIVLLNATGQIVLTREVSIPEGESRIDFNIHHLPVGVYFFQLRYGTYQATMSWIKE